MDRLEEQCATLSPESTTNTRDSGIESLAQRLSEERCDSPSSLGSDAGAGEDGGGGGASTGNRQVDHALLWHLSYCDRLVEVRTSVICAGP